VIGDDPAEALRTVEEALSMWRGGALEEFADEPFARPAVARLEELLETAREMRVEALIANGRTEEAVAEVEELIVRFPLRERLRELQMLALYRWGRQAEALDAYQRAGAHWPTSSASIRARPSSRSRMRSFNTIRSSRWMVRRAAAGPRRRGRRGRDVSRPSLPWRPSRSPL
jgi:DNA-binding SARP family transcriptional activator